MANLGLTDAKRTKNDEFYTQWADIEREVNAYLEYNPDLFRGKTVLLPCDDPEWSNFTKFFALHFRDFGLKKLVSTSYAPNSNAGATFYTPTPFETTNPQYDKTKSQERGRMFVLEPTDVNGDGKIDIDDIQWSYLNGDGDFRSPEVTALRDEADMVITNPPFSLFREFMEWLIDGGRQFSIIGNSNAITYKEVFPLIQQNRVWLGVTRDGNGSMWFRIPDGAPTKSTGQKVEDGVRYQTVGSSAWFTNIDHGRRHEPLQLMTMADNIKFNKALQGQGYATYDNYDAIEVPRLHAIPSDYTGVMGVPITFLGKYNPDQFEIVGATESEGKGFSHGLWDSQSRVSQAVADGERKYKRLFIRHRNPQKDLTP